MEKNCPCMRNLSLHDIKLIFGKSEEEIDKCDKSNCPNLKYQDGILLCELIND